MLSLVGLEWVRDDKEACLSVHDTGRGLSDAAAEQAGNPFYTTPIAGQGMGLSISKTILSQFGGSLLLESTGQSTCARHKMPLLDTATSKPERLNTDIDQALLSAERVRSVAHTRPPRPRRPSPPSRPPGC